MGDCWRVATELLSVSGILGRTPEASANAEFVCDSAKGAAIRKAFDAVRVKALRRDGKLGTVMIRSRSESLIRHTI